MFDQFLQPHNKNFTFALYEAKQFAHFLAGL